MPVYQLQCAEGCSDCFGTAEADVPYINLDDEQLASLNAGKWLTVRAENIPAGYTLDSETAETLQKDGEFEDDYDYRQVCAGCGSES